MFSKEILCSDDFLDLPHGAKILYIYLNLEADDDGFIARTNTCLRMIGATSDELNLLLLKNYLINIDKRIYVITDWRVHNTLRKDRYSPTVYQEAYAKLRIKKNKQYSLSEGSSLLGLESQYSDETELESEGTPMATKWQPNVNQMATIGCHSKAKLSKGKDSKAKQSYIACIANFFSSHAELDSIDGRFHHKLSEYFHDKQIDEDNFEPFVSFVYDDIKKRYENISPNLFYDLCFEDDMLCRFMDSKFYIVKKKMWPYVCPACGEYHNSLGSSENCTLDMSQPYTDADILEAKKFMNFSDEEKKEYCSNIFKEVNKTVQNIKEK